MKLSRYTLEQLEREYADAFYVVDLDAFSRNYQEFLHAFRELYPRTTVAYSYKTNYTPRLCSLIDEWGGYAEVVSRMEYDLAQRVGVNPKRIIFNGPYKLPRDIEAALRRGSVVNLDWPYQVEIIEDLARRFPETDFRIGIRVSFRIPSSEPSRFGFDADDGALSGVFERLRAYSNVEIAGLHCHFLTRERSTADYGFIASRMLGLAAEYFDEPPEYLDLGGGYFSRMKAELRSQFSMRVPTFNEYAEAIAPRFAAQYSGQDAPALILEPGICLTADVVKFAARVVDVKSLGTRKIALVSASIYDVKPGLSHRNLPVEVVRANRDGADGMSGTLDIVGYTCMENDVLYSSFEGSLAIGDYVLFDNVGAYTNVLRPPFIRPCPPMLGWTSSSGEFEVLKRKERFDDVFGTYTFADPANDHR